MPISHKEKKDKKSTMVSTPAQRKVACAYLSLALAIFLAVFAWPLSVAPQPNMPHPPPPGISAWGLIQVGSHTQGIEACITRGTIATTEGITGIIASPYGLECRILRRRAQCVEVRH